MRPGHSESAAQNGMVGSVGFAVVGPYGVDELIDDFTISVHSLAAGEVDFGLVETATPTRTDANFAGGRSILTRSDTANGGQPAIALIQTTGGHAVYRLPYGRTPTQSAAFFLLRVVDVAAVTGVTTMIAATGTARVAVMPSLVGRQSEFREGSLGQAPPLTGSDGIGG